MTTLDIAKQYLQLGWSVIPIQPNSKIPAIKWKNYGDVQPSENDLQTWFGPKNAKNIAVVTGPVSGLVVVDIDDPSLKYDYTTKYPTERIARTAGGGYHLYYAYGGSDIGNSVSKLQSGIDVRGRHGYVLAAPSRVKYDDGREGSYEWVLKGQPLPLPDELRDLILADLRVQQKQNGGDVVTVQKEDGHYLWTRILQDGFTPGRHNEEMKDAARYLYRQGMNEETIINTLAQLNAADDTPLPVSELEATIRSGIGYERGRLEAKAVAAAPKPSSTDDEEFGQSFGDTVIRYQDYADKWLIPGWVPERSVIMAAAAPESFKTWLLIDAAISLAIGNGTAPFLGSEVTAPGLPVLIIQQEDFMGRITRRAQAIYDSKTGDMPLEVSKGTFNLGRIMGLNNIFFHNHARLSLEDDQSVAWLEQFIQKYQIGFVVIDPLYTLGRVDDYFASIARRLGALKALRDKYGTTFLIAHHNRKAGGNGRDGIWGSQLLNAAIEGGWLITKPDDESHKHNHLDVASAQSLMDDTLRTDKQRVISTFGKSFAESRHYLLGFDIAVNNDGQDSYYNVVAQPIGANVNDSERKVLSILEAGCKSQKEIASEFFDREITAKDTREYNQIKKVLDSLLKKGDIVGGGGRNAKYCLPTQTPENI